MRKPRRKKTIEELQPDNVYKIQEDGIAFAIESTEERLPPILFKDLLLKFYKINKGLKPITVQKGNSMQGPFVEPIWWLIMYGNFYLDVLKNETDMDGPHRCRLWFRTFDPPMQNHWLASAQLMAFFFNEKEIRNAAQELVKNKEFYMLPANEKIEVQP